MADVLLLPPRPPAPADPAAVPLLRVPGLALRRFARNEDSYAAWVLAVKFFLALIPLLVVATAFLRAFRALEFERRLKDAVFHYIAPAEQAGVTRFIDDTVERLDSNVLSLLAFLLLSWTVVSLLVTAEEVLNRIFGAPKGRGFLRRFANYWTVLTLGPLLLGGSIMLTAVGASPVEGNAAVSFLHEVQPVAAPALLSLLAFFCLYYFLPNTKVRMGWAFAGGGAAALLFGVLKKGYAVYLGYVLREQPVYGTLAVLPVFLLGIYGFFAILLLGAEVAAAGQFRRLEAGGPDYEGLRSGDRTAWALRALREVARAFARGAPALTAVETARRLGVPAAVVHAPFERLAALGILAKAANPEPRYLPARPLEAIPLEEVLRALDPEPEPLPGDDPAARVLAKVRSAMGEAVKGMTLKDLA